jgi:gentisate 1,2-dioxygenase
VPLTHLLEPMFYQEHPGRYAKVERVVTNSPFRFTRAASMLRGPIPKASTARVLRSRGPDMPPMALAMERLAAGTKIRRYRSTANSIFLVTEGAGESVIGARRFAWQQRDTFMAPSWTRIEHHAGVDAALLTLTDELLMRFRNYFLPGREQLPRGCQSRPARLPVAREREELL